MFQKNQSLECLPQKKRAFITSPEVHHLLNRPLQHSFLRNELLCGIVAHFEWSFNPRLSSNVFGAFSTAATYSCNTQTCDIGEGFMWNDPNKELARRQLTYIHRAIVKLSQVFKASARHSAPSSRDLTAPPGASCARWHAECWKHWRSDNGLSPTRPCVRSAETTVIHSKPPLSLFVAEWSRSRVDKIERVQQSLNGVISRGEGRGVRNGRIHPRAHPLKTEVAGVDPGQRPAHATPALRGARSTESVFLRTSVSLILEFDGEAKVKPEYRVC